MTTWWMTTTELLDLRLGAQTVREQLDELSDHQPPPTTPLTSLFCSHD